MRKRIQLKEEREGRGNGKEKVIRGKYLRLTSPSFSGRRRMMSSIQAWSAVVFTSPTVRAELLRPGPFSSAESKSIITSSSSSYVELM